jgi:hypothetical protein
VGSAGNSNSDTDLVALLSVIVINLFITMPKRIVLINADGDEMGSAKVVNDSDYLNWLHMKELDILVDNDGDDIPGFGALVDGGRYTGRPRQGDTKIPQQRQQLNHIDAYIAKKEADEATVQISNPGLTKYNRAVQKIGVRFDAPEWNQKPTGLEDLASQRLPHTWLPGKEDNPENRKKYMGYLNKNIVLPQGGKLFEGNGMDDLLSIDIEAFGVKTRGNIDVVLASDRHQGVETTRENMWAGIELKRADNKRHAEILRQVILQHLAASYLNPDAGILTIMTDLCDRWHFFWFSKNKAALMQYKASKGEANYLIRHMMRDRSDDTSTPIDFLNRASWNTFFEDGVPHSDQQDKIVAEKGGRDDEDNDNSRMDGKLQGGKIVSGTRDSLVRGGHKASTRTGSSGTDGAKQNTLWEYMDSIDDDDDGEEEKEAIFRQVIERSLPRMVHFPQREGQKQNSDSPPRHVFIS